MFSETGTCICLTRPSYYEEIVSSYPGFYWISQGIKSDNNLTLSSFSLACFLNSSKLAPVFSFILLELGVELRLAKLAHEFVFFSLTSCKTENKCFTETTSQTLGST